VQRTFLLFAWLALLATASGQNLILNPGFEQPGLPNNQLTRPLENGGNFIPGWSVLDDAIGEKPYYAQSPNSDAILSGSYGVILNQGSGLKTTFRAEVGSFYELSVWIRPAECLQCSSPAPLEVRIGASTYFLPLVSGWSRQVVQFFATNSVNTLELINASSPSDFKQFGLDDVSLVKQPGALLAARLYPGIVIQGFTGQKYQIQAASSLDDMSWQTLTNITLTNRPFLFFDVDPGNPLETPPRRIYRAIQVH